MVCYHEMSLSCWIHGEHWNTPETSYEISRWISLIKTCKRALAHARICLHNHVYARSPVFATHLCMTTTEAIVNPHKNAMLSIHVSLIDLSMMLPLPPSILTMSQKSWHYQEGRRPGTGRIANERRVKRAESTWNGPFREPERSAAAGGWG